MVSQQKSTLCLDFNGTLLLVYLALYILGGEKSLESSKKQGKEEREVQTETKEKENEKEDPTEEVRCNEVNAEGRRRRNEEGRRTKRDCERGLDFYLYIYTSFMARSPFFALSFHLVTSLRLVTVRLASPRLVSLFSRLPLTVYEVDPFSNDAPGRSPRYPPVASVRVASLQASSNTLVLTRTNWTLKLPKGWTLLQEEDERGSAYSRSFSLLWLKLSVMTRIRGFQ